MLVRFRFTETLIETKEETMGSAAATTGCCESVSNVLALRTEPSTFGHTWLVLVRCYEGSASWEEDTEKYPITFHVCVAFVF